MSGYSSQWGLCSLVGFKPLPPSAIDDILNDDCLQLVFLFASSAWDLATLIAISHVSRRWRNLALSYAALWSRVSINESLTKSGSSLNIRRLNILLQRSSQCPLRVRVVIPQHLWGTLFLIPRILSPLYSRIVHFELLNLSPTGTFHSALQAMFEGRSFPLLRSFIVECPNIQEKEFTNMSAVQVHTARTTLLPFMGAQHSSTLHPNLKEIKLHGALCDWNKYSVNNLTTLVISTMPVKCRPPTAQLRSILSTSKDTLKVLKIAGALPRDRHTDDLTIKLSHLETLSLFYTKPEELSTFVNYIQAPGLKNLEIGNLGHRSPPPGRDQQYAHTASAFRSIVGHFPVEKLEEVTLLDVYFGPGTLRGLWAHEEPLELLSGLVKEKGVLRKLKIEVKRDCFLWVAGDGAEDVGRALEAWRRKFEEGDIL